LLSDDDELLTDGGMCFTNLKALVPRVMRFGVTRTSAVSVPRTSATATTASARSPDFAACGALRNGRRRGSFAGLHAIKPPVTNVSADDTSAVSVPSTARSATTDSAGFLEFAALWTRQRDSGRRGPLD